MALLAAQSISLTGNTATYSAVNASDTLTYTNAPRVLHVKNGGGGSITVTIVVPGSTHGQANPDIPITIGAGADKFITGFTSDLAVDGVITVQYSGTSSVTAALLAVS